jgi:hypothetical protein
MRSWMASSDEFTARDALRYSQCHLKDQPDSPSEADAGRILKTIENEIHVSRTGLVTR